MIEVDPTQVLKNRLLSSVLRRCHKDDRGCFVWRGATSSKGYGRIRMDGRLISTHRAVAYAKGMVATLFDGERKENVLHTCDNPRCCNPAHLFVGTLSDNMKDCSSKGRLAQQRRGLPPLVGPKVGRVKFSVHDVKWK